MAESALPVTSTDSSGSSWVSPDPDRLARQLFAAASVWSKTLMLCLGRDGSGPLFAVLQDEILAFGLALTELQLYKRRGGDGRRFLRALGRRLSTMRRNCRDLPRLRNFLHGGRGNDVGAHSASEQVELVKAGRAYCQFHLTEEMYAEFCNLTGLAKETLVGHGSNLASILFYMSIHGRVYAEGNIPRHQTNRDLKAARECRNALEESVRNAFETRVQGVGEAELGLAALKSPLVTNANLLRDVLQTEEREPVSPHIKRARRHE